jgi:hypothetical protein
VEALIAPSVACSSPRPVTTPATPSTSTGSACYEFSMSSELPDFRIPHAEKIEWMIETSGWALEPVSAQVDTDPPRPGYAYTIGFPASFGFPEVIVFGLTPVAVRGLIDLVADLLRGGTEIPIGVELVGLFDNELRCLFAPVDCEIWADLVGTAIAWYRGGPFDMVQLLWPDRNGFLPTEAGFDQRVRAAQPVIGSLDG